MHIGCPAKTIWLGLQTCNANLRQIRLLTESDQPVSGVFVMLKRTALLRLLALAMVLVASYVFGSPSHEAQAQQAQQGSQINPDSLVIRPRRLKLRDVWGPPMMPPTPKDFGPHFDFPAGGSMNLECGPPDGKQYFCGGPSQAPYPN